MAGKPNDEKRPIIIIKRVKKGGDAHHGGAWKVAYADFVTAMMSFFLLLWLLNVTTDEQKMLISSYFAPADPRIATSTSGSGGVLGGTTMSPTGAMTSVKSPVTAMQEDPAAGVGREEGDEGDKQKPTAEEQQGQDLDKADESAAAKAVDASGENAAAKAADKASDSADNKAFEAAEDKIKQAIEQQPELKELAQNLLVDTTPEGLRIQVVDQEGKPMFEVGSAKPLPAAEKLFALVAKVVKDLPNKISLRGHTDARPYGHDAAYTNWELSADRANAARRSILADGLDITRIENVQGKADRELLVAADPQSARNRRISILLLKQSLTGGVKKPETKPAATAPKPSAPKEPDTKKHEEGVIYFP